MTHPTKSRRSGKVVHPKRCKKDFPLWVHKASGQWCKKVAGRFHYFGKVADDPDGQVALERWLDFLAGRSPRSRAESLTVADLCNHFLTHKRGLVESHELASRTFQRYHANCALLVSQFGKLRPVEELAAPDFQALRTTMTKQWGPVAVANEIQMTRSVFRYGYEAGLLDKPVRFGPGFKKPSAKTIRQTRIANGPRIFTAEQIKTALKHATTNMKAMLLLAVNGGLGNTDVALLPISAVDFKGGWLDYPRAKTAIPRRIPLWPETIKTLKAVLSSRPESMDQDDAGLLFIGRRRQNYIGNHKGYRVTAEWRRVADKAGIEERTFYDGRRTFQTIAEGARDLVAVQSIMGHAPASGDMSAIYRQRVDDDELRKAYPGPPETENTVRGWPFEVSQALRTLRRVSGIVHKAPEPDRQGNWDTIDIGEAEGLEVVAGMLRKAADDTSKTGEAAADGGKPKPRPRSAPVGGDREGGAGPGQGLARLADGILADRKARR